MDMTSVGAAIALTGGAATRAMAAAAAAESAAGEARTATQAAEEATGDAKASSSKYIEMNKDAYVDRTAFNYFITATQAEIRSLEKRVTAAESALARLT